MAEVVSSVMGLLYPLINAEVSLISGLRDEVVAIGDELRSISACLKHVEERADEDGLVKQWVRDVRTLAHKIEDVIEEYKLLSNGNKFIDKVKKIVTLNNRTIAKTIKSLREKAVEIGQRKTNYRFNSVNQQAGQFWNFEGSTHQSTILSVGMTKESQLVDAETAINALIGKLDLKKFEDSTKTIAVIGMSGLGKTAIVASVYYNDEMVKEYFPFRAWILVPRQYNHVDILRSMLKQFYEAASELTHFENHANDPTFQEINSMEEIFLLSRLMKFLAEKRYLVVFDNVGEKGTELATCIKSALPINDNKGSKIIMTTRYENVARFWVDGSDHGLYKFEPLPPKEAWQLFCKKAFKDHEGNNCPQYLNDLAQEVIKRCQGLPLIISEIGRHLSTKLDDLHEWKKKSQSLGLQQDHTGIYKLLTRSSYHDLPHYLKPCFLYFGLFPEGYPVGKTRIVRLWIAEGFIIIGRENGEAGKLTPEEIAEKYIKELVGMDLVKECTDATGKSKTLRVSVLLREIILSKVKEMGFCQILPDKNNSFSTEDFVMPRRLSIHMDNHRFHDADLQVVQSSSHVADHRVVQSMTKSKSNIRSLLYAETNLCPDVLTNLFSKNFRLLKVLDFCNAPIDDLPNQVGELLNLHYLSIRNTQVSRLPNSIGKLQYLQTLDLKQTLIHELPADLKKLHKLRHLLTYSYKNDPTFSLHVQKMTGVKLTEKVWKILENYRS